MEKSAGLVTCSLKQFAETRWLTWVKNGQVGWECSVVEQVFFIQQSGGGRHNHAHIQDEKEAANIEAFSQYLHVFRILMKYFCLLPPIMFGVEELRTTWSMGIALEEGIHFCQLPSIQRFLGNCVRFLGNPLAKFINFFVDCWGMPSQKNFCHEIN